MNKFAKTLLAAALFAGAGAANASINVSNSTARELYMQVYDSVQKKTFSLDLGITLATLNTKRTDAGYEVSVDLSSDANWLAFTSVATFNPAATQYVLAVGRGGTLYATQQEGNVLPEYADTTSIANASSGITNHAQEINYGAPADSLNISKLVADTQEDTAKWATGLGNLPFDLWNTTPGSQAAVNYGQKADFWAALGGTSVSMIKMPGQWLLSGSTLEYKVFPVSNVPLPAAVWMFGAGVMGLLGATRRKSQAV